MVYCVYYCNRADVIVDRTIYKKSVYFSIKNHIRGIVFQINKYRRAVKVQLSDVVFSADFILQFIRVCEEIGYVVASVIARNAIRYIFGSCYYIKTVVS